jgi:putative glycosyltransferase
VVESIAKLPERSIFFGGIVSWVGFRSTHIDVKRSPRHAGRSKYNFIRRFALAMNAITSFSERPLIFIFQLGILVFIFSLTMFGYAIFKKIFYNVAIMGWTSLFAAIFFSTGLITLSLSVVGLYISKLFIEVKKRPRYIVREIAE